MKKEDRGKKIAIGDYFLRNDTGTVFHKVILKIKGKDGKPGVYRTAAFLPKFVIPKYDIPESDLENTALYSPVAAANQKLAARRENILRELRENMERIENF
jgi:hypothetical protein